VGKTIGRRGKFGQGKRVIVTLAVKFNEGTKLRLTGERIR
jgi:hypothetical protein